MANYSLVLDTKFKPFSYAEMLAPVAAATQAHQALEEEYGNLSAKADVWENMANEQSDPLAYKMYKGYSDDLRDRADTLLREGLNASSRKGMLDMRARYSKEIAPIEISYKRREELAAEQRKAYAANPTLRYERYANAMSLDDFIKNPSIDYGRSYSGALLTQQVAQAAANYAKVLTREGKLKSLGLPYQYTKDLGYGATPEQVLAVINKAAQDGEEGAISFLRGIRDQVIASSGTNAWITPGSAAAKERDAFANMGLYSALGQTQIKDYTDTYSMNNALAIAKERRDREAAEAAALKMYKPRFDTWYGTSDIAKKNKEVTDTMKNTIYKYFNPSNNYAMSKYGNEVLKRKPKERRITDDSGKTHIYYVEDPEKQKLVSALKSIGVSNKMIEDFTNSKSTNPVPLNNYVRALRNRINKGGNDFVLGTPNVQTINYFLGEEDRKAVKDVIGSKINKTGIEKIEGLHTVPGKTIGNHNREAVSVEASTTNISKDAFMKDAEEYGIIFTGNVPNARLQYIELGNGDRYMLSEDILGKDAYNNLNFVDNNKPIRGLNAQLLYQVSRGASDLQKANTINNMGPQLLGPLTTQTKGANITPADGTYIVR